MSTYSKDDVNALLAASANLERMEREAQRFIEIINGPLFRYMKRHDEEQYGVLFTPFETLDVPGGHALFDLRRGWDVFEIRVQYGSQPIEWFKASLGNTSFTALPMRMIRPVREHLHDLLTHMALGGDPLDPVLVDVLKHGHP